MPTDLSKWAVLALVACKGGGDDPTPGAAPVAPEGVVVEVVAAMPTVLRVSWTTAEPASGYVVFTAEGGERSTLPLPEGTEHEQLLVGLPPDVDVEVEVVASVGGEDVAAEVVTARTGALVGAPTFTVEGSSDRYMVLPLVDDDLNTIVVLDPQGRVVWQHRDERALSVFRAHVALDGSGVIYTATLKNGEPNEASLVVRVPWDGGPERTQVVPWLAHDFVEQADGTLVSLAYEYRDDIQGNKLVAIAPDGTSTTLWSAWDCFDPAVHPSIDLEHGWTHANALDADADAFYVNMRNLTSLVKVDAASGECLWGFGGAAGTVDITGPTFYHQHQFEVLDGGLLVFDNDGAGGLTSRAIEYAFDEGSLTASLVKVFTADPPEYSFILGDVHRVDGDTMITWSVPNLIDRMGPDGARVYRLKADDDDLIFGFTELMVDPGRPDLGIQH